jgi:hypothetical protein
VTDTDPLPEVPDAIYGVPPTSKDPESIEDPFMTFR